MPAWGKMSGLLAFEGLEELATVFVSQWETRVSLVRHKGSTGLLTLYTLLSVFRPYFL